MIAKAVLFTGPGQVELGESELPSPGPGEVLLEIVYSCISPGTDLRTLSGKQSGIAGWPVVPGYSQVGRVIEKGPGVSLGEGTAVFASGTQKGSVNTTWGGHISHSVVAETNVVPIPGNVDLLAASAAKLGAISYHGSLCSGVKQGEEVAVVGLGPIGMLSAIFHRLAGARVVAFDLSADRCAHAESLGIEAHVPENSLREIGGECFPEGPDIVVDSTGIEPVLAGCLEMAREIPWTDSDIRPTRILLQGSYPGNFSIDYNTAFMKEATIVVSRDHRPADLRSVIQAMSDERVNLAGIISKVVPCEDAPAMFEDLRGNKGGILTAAIKWQA